MGRARTCGYKGCKNLKKTGYERCWQHLNVDAAEVESFDDIVARREAREGVAPSTFINPAHGYSIYHYSDRQMHADIIGGNTPMSDATASSVLAAMDSIKDDCDLEVPRVAGGAIERLFPAFVKALKRSGVAEDRISVMQLIGLDRQTLKGRPFSHPEAYHEVVVLDRGTKRESLIDPFIAIYAPVSDQDRNVNDQLPSGITPFGDIPWIGAVKDYIDGHYMQWSDTRYEDEKA